MHVAKPEDLLYGKKKEFNEMKRKYNKNTRCDQRSNDDDNNNELMTRNGMWVNRRRGGAFGRHKETEYYNRYGRIAAVTRYHNIVVVVVVNNNDNIL